MKPLRDAVRGACALALALALNACGSSKTPANPDPPATQITGIATPSSVSVVTATNAN